MAERLEGAVELMGGLELGDLAGSDHAHETRVNRVSKTTKPRAPAQTTTAAMAHGDRLPFEIAVPGVTVVGRTMDVVRLGSDLART